MCGRKIASPMGTAGNTAYCLIDVPSPTMSGNRKSECRRLRGERMSATAARTGKQAAMSVLVSAIRHPMIGHDNSSIALIALALGEKPNERQIMNTASAAPIEKIIVGNDPPRYPHPSKAMGRIVVAPP